MTDFRYPARAQNFRAIGALPAADGRRLRPNLLYRTGDMSSLREECVERIAQLGIRTVVDLRSGSERRIRPYTWLASIDADAWNDRCELSSAAISALIDRQEATVDEVVVAMGGLYRDIAVTYAESFGELCRRIIAGRLPLLFGCAAGKDRTGVAAALLLWLLGVPREDIVADYMRTNAALDTLLHIVEEKYGWDVSSPRMRAALLAEPSYLDALFAFVTERFGGIEGYFGEMLGIDAEGRKMLAERLLE
jgi:protein-tyrosine phosphatase